MLSNSVWNYAGTITTIAIALATTPIYLGILGLERFGLLAVLVALIAPIGVINAGINEATVKFVASFSSVSQLGAARESVAAALAVNLVIGFTGALVCVFGAPYALSLGFKIPPELFEDAVLSLRIFGAVWFSTQIAGNFRGVLVGFRDQKLVVIGDILSTLVNAVLCTTFAFLGGKLHWFVTGQFLASAIAGLFWWMQARRALQGFLISRSTVQSRIKEVFGYSKWQVLNSGVAVLANVGDRYFIGIFLSAASLGAYSVILRIQGVSRTLFTAVNNALFPAASAASSKSGASEKMVVKATWHVALFAGLGLGCITICGPAFIELWVGRPIADLTGIALRVLVVTLLFEIPSATCSSYLNAHAQTRLTSFNNILTTLVTLGLMLPLGVKFGLNGVALSGLIGLTATRVPFHVWIYSRYFAHHLPSAEFFKGFYGVGLCCLASALLVCPVFDHLFSRSHSIPGFLLASALCIPIFGLLVLAAVAFLLRDRILLGEVRATATEAVLRLMPRNARA